MELVIIKRKTGAEVCSAGFAHMVNIKVWGYQKG